MKNMSKNSIFKKKSKEDKDFKANGPIHKKTKEISKVIQHKLSL